MERTAKRRKRSARTPRPSCCDSGDSSCDYSWPPSDPSARKLPSNSLLSSLDELLWRAMARINPLDDDTKKLKTCQVFVREALGIIGLDFVATNNTSHRIALGSENKYDLARKLFEEHGYALPKPLPEIRRVEIIDRDLPRHLIYSGCYMDVMSDARRDIRAHLVSDGVVLIKNAFAGGIPQHACRLPANSKRTKIAYTSGNGNAGVANSYYADSTSEYWAQVQDNILRALLTGDDCYSRVKSQKKAIFLSYSQGSENWAHQDDNKDPDFPFQATALLTNEFDGGEFYVAKKIGIDKIARTIVGMRDKGDMVLFAASKELRYFHGMLRITRGERMAVGLFQKKG